MYKMRRWVDRQVEYPRRFTEEKSGSYTTLKPEPGVVSQEGTPFSADNMNNIETGIDAFALMSAYFFQMYGTAVEKAVMMINGKEAVDGVVNLMPADIGAVSQEAYNKRDQKIAESLLTLSQNDQTLRDSILSVQTEFGNKLAQQGSAFGESLSRVEQNFTAKVTQTENRFSSQLTQTESSFNSQIEALTKTVNEKETTLNTTITQKEEGLKRYTDDAVKKAQDDLGSQISSGNQALNTEISNVKQSLSDFQQSTKQELDNKYSEQNPPPEVKVGVEGAKAGELATFDANGNLVSTKKNLNNITLAKMVLSGTTLTITPL